MFQHNYLEVLDDTQKPWPGILSVLRAGVPCRRAEMQGGNPHPTGFKYQRAETGANTERGIPEERDGVWPTFCT